VQTRIQSFHDLLDSRFRGNDDFLRSRQYWRNSDGSESFENLPFSVTPAKAGVQKVLKRLDTGFRRGDDLQNFKSKALVVEAAIKAG